MARPSLCNSFKVGMKVKLSDYVPGEEDVDDKGSVLLIGSPDSSK